MREIVLSVLILALAATMASGICTKADIIGVWESQGDILELCPAGKCRIDQKKAHYRLHRGDKVTIYQNGNRYDFSYMISFDNKTMQFGNRSYNRIDQSGAERSIMELFE